MHTCTRGGGGGRKERENILKLKQRKGKVQSDLKPRKRDPHERHGPQPVCTETLEGEEKGGRGEKGRGEKGGEGQLLKND